MLFYYFCSNFLIESVFLIFSNLVPISFIYFNFFFFYWSFIRIRGICMFYIFFIDYYCSNFLIESVFLIFSNLVPISFIYFNIFFFYWSFIRIRGICMCYIFFMLNFILFLIYFRRTKCFLEFFFHDFLEFFIYHFFPFFIFFAGIKTFFFVFFH